jgi:histidine triad (HIT) family protein
MDRSDCIFCKIISGQIPSAKIYEDESVFAFLDIGPISDGHTLVIPKVHCEKVDQCPPAVLAAVWSKMPQIVQAVSSAIDCQGYNVLCNNGKSAGQIVEHVHFHIIPRRTGDGLLNGWPAFKYPAGRIEELAKRIRERLG